MKQGVKRLFFHGFRHDGTRSTFCGDYDESKGEIVYARANTSKKDNFSREKGRIISSGRLDKGSDVLVHKVTTNAYGKEFRELCISKLNE